MPVAVQLENQGGSSADLSNLAVFYDVGEGQRIPAGTTGDITGNVSPGAGATLNFNTLIAPAHVGKTVSIKVVGDSETAVSVHLLLPPPVVRIIYNDGNPNPVAIYDETQENWLATVSLTSVVEDKTPYQSLDYTWTILNGSESDILKDENINALLLKGPFACIPYQITLTVRATYHGYDTSSAASVSSQCRESS